MKKSLFFLPLLAVTLFSFAGEPKKNDPRTERAFASHFIGAEQISWTKVTGDYLKVSFLWNGRRTEAYFNENAELVGSARIIFYEQLPMAVTRGIESNFAGSTTIEIAEIYMDDSTTYNILLETAKHKYKVHFNSAGQIIQKTRVK
jgi:hypothetical protein